MGELTSDIGKAYRDFQKKVFAASTAPYDESPGYREFMTWYPFCSLALFFVAPYLSVLFFSGNLENFTSFLKTIPLISGRIEFLNSADSSSIDGFTATVIVAAILTPIVFGIHFFGYWNTTLRGGKSKRLKPLAVVNILEGGAIIFIALWVTFVDTPKSSNHAHVGGAAIFFWPIFPAFGAMVLWLFEFWAFGAFILLLKMSGFIKFNKE